MATRKMAVSEIRVGRRVRRDMGNLKALASSIGDIGLLQPAVVSTEGKLVAGERRLEACKMLGWHSVPVHSVDLEALLMGEAAENLIRKDFLPSELIALKRALEPLERKLAKERQGTRTDLRANLDTKFGKTRDRIADRLVVLQELGAGLIDC
jgi:ParB family chromosome partitioning protein